MRVNTVGGGPGGLYASFLLKELNPSWDVTVYERNPPDVTYGWGVVFPGRALSKLESFDPETHAVVTDACERWEPFDTYVDGERYRCNGHTFSSIMRTDLLELLQERCRDVGVELVFETEIDDPSALADESDLVVGADGINSRVREAFADEFGTTRVEGTTRFSWFGTNRSFDALSHIFVENEHGLWAAHTYPGRVSTFVVDCDAETWRNAGIDRLSEAEYLAYVEEVFSDYLDGHDVLSQVDRWRTFTTIRNRSWSHENVVLLGDAVHTAHYSIGSGTTIAFEDAIALRESFEEHGTIETAFEAYEYARRPAVESLQTVAERSRIHFENIRRYADLPAYQFTVHHMTRSGRLSYESLSNRDPSFVREFDRRFANDYGDPSLPEAAPRDHPFVLRDVTYPTRHVRPVLPTTSALDGVPSEELLSTFRSAADGTTGLVLTEPLAVVPEGRSSAGSPGIYTEVHEKRWADAVSTVSDRTDTVVGAHIGHAGMRSGCDPRAFAIADPMPREDAWSPPRSNANFVHPGRFEPANVPVAECDELVERFVVAAKRADRAGFDHLQIHAGHGTLLSAFLSPVTNDRTDAYGGSTADRVRFPADVVTAVRDVWPDGNPLGVTLQVADWCDGGLDIDEGIRISHHLVEAGCDIVAPVAGGTGLPGRPDRVKGVSNYSDDVRNEVGVPIIATTFTGSADKVNTLIGTGRADLCTFFGPHTG